MPATLVILHCEAYKELFPEVRSSNTYIKESSQQLKGSHYQLARSLDEDTLSEGVSFRAPGSLAK